MLQVGIVRQVETAAVKASEKSRGPFQRQLTASYTSATIEAGERADVGEPAAAPSGNGWSSAGLCAHLLVITEGDAKSTGVPADLLCHVHCYEDSVACSTTHLYLRTSSFVTCFTAFKVRHMAATTLHTVLSHVQCEHAVASSVQLEK